CHPNDAKSTANAASFTIGEVIKNERVTPNGTPASINPINIGTEEHEQNGVTVPSRDAMIFPETPEYLSSIFFVFSGGK
ncbi:MAG: hypothetical protein PWP73_1296, partial [Methanococcus sp.]|nr:hypothetical protein [Methanococcus sp.]